MGIYFFSRWIVLIGGECGWDCEDKRRRLIWLVDLNFISESVVNQDQGDFGIHFICGLNQEKVARVIKVTFC